MTRAELEQRYRDIFENHVLPELMNVAEKWGVQKHPPHVDLVILGEEVGEAFKTFHEHGLCRKYDDELKQSAAMAIRAVESNERAPDSSNLDLSPNSLSVLRKVQRAGFQLEEISRTFLEKHYYSIGLHKVNSESLES